GLAVYSGNPQAIASAGADLAASAVGLASPIPGTGLAIKAARAADKVGDAVRVANGITNPVPSTLARVIQGEGPFPTLGLPGNSDVFVTAADDIAGLNAAQLAERLTVNSSEAFTVVKFPTPQSGLASPINRLDKGFIGGGQTAGGAREYVIPNGPIPIGATTEVVK
ncbi:MAG: polymorphic toxin type 10 domain-containing protein, partial [Gammaproteobacteria bacterium]